MSSPSSAEHWLDRLASRHTRRQALKAAVAGSAALTLPLVRPAAARAGDPHACQQGCNWTAHQRYKGRLDACTNQALGSYLISLGAGATYGVGIALLAIPNGLFSAIGRQDKCGDQALLEAKATMYDCTQPDCPGFDPSATGGPCDTCTANCCPCSIVQSGYICCIYLCDDPNHKCCPS